jgi:hypothetical protein
MNAEDDPADTTKPRLEAHGADMSRIVMPQYESASTDEYQPICFDEASIGELEKAIEERGDVRLVVIDPLMVHLSEKVDPHKDADIRRVLSRLGQLAQRHGLAIIGVVHLNKNSQESEVLHRVMGSTAIIAAARSGLLVAAEPDDTDHRIIGSIKSNLAEPPPSLRFHIGGNETPAICWDGESELTAEEAIQAQSTASSPKAADKDRVLGLTVRKGGEITANELRKKCRAIETSEQATEILGKLAADGLGDWENRNHGSQGGRPTEVFVVRPPDVSVSETSGETTGELAEVSDT